MTSQPSVRVQNRTRQRPSVSESVSNRLVVVQKNPDELRAASKKVRRAGKGQVKQIENNIERFGCLVPILATEDGEIIDGHNIWRACKNRGSTVPTIFVSGLNDAEVRALRISLNRLAELSSWDDESLQEELMALLDTDPELLFYTGFTPAEIDAFADAAFEQDDEESLAGTGLTPLGQDGDVWVCEEQVLMQGNARLPASYDRLLGQDLVQAVVSDIPFGCSIAGHASRSHPDFMDGSSMSTDELEELIRLYFTNCSSHLEEGALAYTFMDGRGLRSLLNTAASVGQKQIALCVWDKINPGMGSFYRQQAEYVLVSKLGKAPHLNNVSLGKNGRNRSTIWCYSGLAGFGASRSATLAMHPTVKPIGLISDILLDCTRRGGSVLDPFAGSGTILLAAHRTKRRAFAMELDPKYIDVAIRRLERQTGAEAINRDTGVGYSQTMKMRSQA